jgi:hypothetical protein
MLMLYIKAEARTWTFKTKKLMWKTYKERKLEGIQRFSVHVQTGPGAPPGLLYSGYRVTGSLSRGYSGSGVALTTHLHLALRLKKE